MADAASQPPAFWQQVCDSTVPGRDRDHLGEWVLRSDLGNTGRANSVWPRGDPGIDLDEATATAERWYRTRSRPTIFQVYDGTDPAVSRVLDARDYGYIDGADVLAVDIIEARSRLDPVEAGSSWSVSIADEPTSDFLRLTEIDRVTEMLRAVTWRAFVTCHDATGALGGGGLAIMAPGTDAVGVFSMKTTEPFRRRGVARLVMTTLLKHGADAGARTAFLQVMVSNAPARALYRSCGFNQVEHYEYRVHP